jgi:hypothetical protein
MFLVKATLASLLTEVHVSPAGPSIATDSIPAAIDHFHVRFDARVRPMIDGQASGS